MSITIEEATRSTSSHEHWQEFLDQPVEMISRLPWKGKLKARAKKLRGNPSQQELAAFLKSTLQTFPISKKEVTGWLSYLKLSLMASTDSETSALIAQVMEANSIQSNKKSRNRWEECSVGFRELIADHFEYSLDSEQVRPDEFIHSLLTFSYLMLSVGSQLSESTLIELWTFLFTQAQQIQQFPREVDSNMGQAVLAMQLNGEWPWLAGVLFCQIKGFDEFSKNGAKHLGKELEKLTDTDGTPHIQFIRQMGPWLASCYRSRHLAKQLDLKFWRKSQEKRYQQLLVRLSSLVRESGQLLMNDHPDPILQQTLSQCLDDLESSTWIQETQRRLSRTGSKVQKQSTNIKQKQRRRIVDEESHSQTDWGQFSSLRNNWLAGSDQLGITYEDKTHECFLDVLGLPLLEGVWDLNVSINGQPYDISQDWMVSCWHSVEEGDYLELHYDDDQLVIDRHIFLSRDDHFALLADAVQAEGKIGLLSQLPLVSGWKVNEDQWCRSLELRSQKRRVRALPLFLTDDKLHPTDGACQIKDGSLKLSQESDHTCFTPLILDWSPERNGQDPEWRPLTVTEEGRKLTPQQAPAYRFRIGRHQWVLLKNLEYTGDVGRALLGMHTESEFVLGEFQSDGEVNTLVDVHYEEEDDDD